MEMWAIIHGHGTLLPIYRTACGKTIAELGATYTLTGDWGNVTCPQCLEAHKRGEGIDMAVEDEIQKMKMGSHRR